MIYYKRKIEIIYKQKKELTMIFVTCKNQYDTEIGEYNIIFVRVHNSKENAIANLKYGEFCFEAPEGVDFNDLLGEKLPPEEYPQCIKDHDKITHAHCYKLEYWFKQELESKYSKDKRYQTYNWTFHELVKPRNESFKPIEYFCDNQVYHGSILCLNDNTSDFSFSMIYDKVYQA